MKVALIFPRLKEQVHGMWPPLGIITLGTILRGRGHEVRCYDSSFDPGPERVIAEIERNRFDLVGLSCLTDAFPTAARIVAAAKAAGAVTVMGGPHPTIAAEETLRSVPGLDYAVRGEGEESLPALLDCIGAGREPSAIPGLGFRRGDEIVLTGAPVPVADLDSIPIPDRDLLDVHPQYLRARAINLHASRGCPFRCRFCQPTLDRLFGKKLRFQSPGRVAEEIEDNARRYGIRDYFFHDDTFTVSAKWMEGVRQAFAEHKVLDGFRYVVNSRVDTFDENKARLLKAMNVYYILFGIESGSQELLDSMDKGTTLAQAREAFRICKKFGLRTHAYVLLGSPAETPATLAATESLVEELKPNTVHISIFTPLLGTHFADELRAQNRIPGNDFYNLDYYLKHSSVAPVLIPGLEYKDLLDSRARILKRRKFRVMADNARELVRDLARDRSLDKLFFRYQFYRRMQHYFG